MQKNTSVTLGAHYEKFIADQVSRGHFSTASETIRAGLQLLEEREIKKALLRKALIEGEESGEGNYSLKAILETLDNERLV